MAFFSKCAAIAGSVGVLALFFSPAVTPVYGQAVPVKVVKQNDSWQLLRGGKPYFIKGAGGSDRLELLKASGGNSIRTWGADNAGKDLDAAQKLGLTVTVGIWLGHPQHGFKYDDPKMVADQLAKARAVVAKNRDHPALLAWGVGNEMEMASGGNDDNVWRAVEEIAKAIKELDPNHPTVTVIAEIGDGGIKAKKVAKLCPSIDILGVNSYGGLASLPTRLRAADWNKPYMVTEFGTNGTWEVGKTAWGAPLEPSSTEKGREYAARYASGIASQKEWCVGSYVFLWGEKVEGTPTWFGMFLPGTGEKLGTVDAMATAWRGSPPPHLVPQIVRVASSAASKEIAPGSRQTVALSATGSGPLSVRYEIRPEMTDHGNHEPGQKAGAAIAGIVPPEGAPGGEQAFTAPRATGAYRLYLTVRDKDGGAATANLPFFVK